MTSSANRRLILIVGLLLTGLLLRIAFITTTTPKALLSSGGDTKWYMLNGAGLVSPYDYGYASILPDGASSISRQPPAVATEFVLPFDSSRLPTPPVYLYFVGIWQQVVDAYTAMRIIQGIQAVLGVAVCALAYRIMTHIASPRAGLFAAALLALSPAYIAEAAQIVTESLYIFFVVGGVAAYLEWMPARDKPAETYVWLFICALLLGLATLTRAVLLAFPLGLALHAAWIAPRRETETAPVPGRVPVQTGQRWRAAAVIILLYSVVVGAWSAYNWLRYERIVIASDQLTPAIWRGATDADGSPRQNDSLLQDASPSEQTRRIISQNPVQYVQRRVRELSSALLQPHGTLYFSEEGQSLKDSVQRWIASGFSGDSFTALIDQQGIWAKLAIYIWHYGSLIGAVAGTLLLRERWRYISVLWGIIGYTLLVHLVLLALPRYLFPLHPFLICLTAIALAEFYSVFHHRISRHQADAAHNPR